MKFALPVILASTLVLGAARMYQTSTSCNATALKNQITPMLKPDFKYDSSKISRITFSDKKQKKEIEVPLFSGEKYRFVFNTAGLPLDVEINIYEESVVKSDRKPIYSTTEETDKSKTIFVFEPKKSKKMYIDYDIPASSDTSQQGCIVFLLGYKS